MCFTTQSGLRDKDTLPSGFYFEIKNSILKIESGEMTRNLSGSPFASRGDEHPPRWSRGIDNRYAQGWGKTQEEPPLFKPYPSSVSPNKIKGLSDFGLSRLIPALPG